MHETIKFYDTVCFVLSDKLALKTPNVLIKNMALFVDFVFFFKKLAFKTLIDKFYIKTLKFYVTLRFALKKLFRVKKRNKMFFDTLRFTPNCVFNTKSLYMVRYFLER
jgi:hypothetical protein